MSGKGDPNVLKQKICNASANDDWPYNLMEWNEIPFDDSHDTDTCVCGRTNIKKIILIQNDTTGEILELGSTCIEKIHRFLLFIPLIQMFNDNERKLTVRSIGHAGEQEWIDDEENAFYLSIVDEKNLSDEQHQKLADINKTCASKMEQRTSKITEDINSIIKNNEKSLSCDAALFLFLNDSITPWEWEFCVSNCESDFSEMSTKQQSFRKEINEKITRSENV